MTSHLNILIFTFFFLSITFWIQIWLFLSTLGHKKKTFQAITNTKLLTLIKERTTYSLDKIYLTPTHKLFGMMTGFQKPKLILSKAVYEQFNSDELEYVLLHEMGHFLLHHIIKEVIVGLLFLTIGIFLVLSLKLSIIASLFLGLVCGIGMVRLGRLHEYEADSYSLSHMTNPQGMITATTKFQNQYRKPHHKILEILFFRGNPYQNRIDMAKKEISKRLAL